MDLISPNLKLPYLAPAQAQKHVTHNEALRQLDAIVQLSVATVTGTPPASPENGDRVIIGDTPTGDFADKPHQVAAFQDGAWAYYPPKTGWQAYIEDYAEIRIFDGSLWKAVSTSQGTNTAQMTDSVNACGGPNEFYGLPSVNGLIDGRGGMALTQNRVMFSPIYVDRPTELIGGFVAQYGASLTAGSVLRAGIFHLGTANGNHWDIGDLVADLGTQPADSAGHKDFTLSTSLTLAAGWYATAVGTDGAGADVRYLKTLQGGAAYVSQFGSGAGSDVYFAGAANYLFDSNMLTEIVDGFSTQWPSNPVTDISTSNGFGYLPFIPKWTRWN